MTVRPQPSVPSLSRHSNPVRHCPLRPAKPTFHVLNNPVLSCEVSGVRFELELSNAASIIYVLFGKPDVFS